MVVTDYEGKVVEWAGTREDALSKGYNVDCTGCSRCSDCSDCSYCSRCSGCSDCSRCSGCSDCSYCSYCSRCSGCSDCSRCSGCSDCSYCSRCSGCSDCSRCSGCSDCSDCSGCSYCSGCSGCSDCSTQPKANLITGTWVTTVRQDDTVRIGCQDFSVDEWLSFTDERIAGMDPRAAEFMKTWKPVILAILGRS